MAELDSSKARASLDGKDSIQEQKNAGFHVEESSHHAFGADASAGHNSYRQFA
jgi:hypothetical protein